MRFNIFIFAILILAFSCQIKSEENVSAIKIDKKILVNDWAHNDYPFVLSIYDSLISGIDVIDHDFRPYKISNDTLLVDFPNKYIRKWDKYRILKLNKDSLAVSRLDSGLASFEDSILRFHKAKHDRIKNVNINSIEFSSSPHHGDSPIISLRVNDNCEIFYEEEGGGTPFIGKFYGKYDPQTCQRVKEYLQLFDFTNMPEELGSGPIGNQHYYFKINYNNNQEKEIYDGGNHSAKVLDLVRYFLNLHEFIKLQPCDSVDFEISTKKKLMEKNF